MDEEMSKKASKYVQMINQCHCYNYYLVVITVIPRLSAALD